MGLRWKDLQLDAGRLSVSQKLARHGEKVAFGLAQDQAGRRSIALDAVTVAALQAQRKAQVAERLLFGPGPKIRTWSSLERTGVRTTRT